MAVDAPGHGRSSDLRLDLADTASWLASAGGAATYVGYSMGGRMCMHAALAAPESVRGLVLISATAGLDDARARAERRARDDELARRIESIGVAAFLDEWLTQPMFAGLDASAQGLAARLENTPSGLASSLRLTGTGMQEPLWDRLDSLTIPVLVVAGALDAKFVTLAERLAATIPGADLAIVDGAGHTVHLEQPERFLETLLPWLGGHAESANPSASTAP